MTVLLAPQLPERRGSCENFLRKSVYTLDLNSYCCTGICFQVKNAKNDRKAQKSKSIQEQQRRTLHLELKTVVRQP